MFADDCLLYREICSMNETKILQGDLDSLPAWEHPEQDCLMEFNHLSARLSLSRRKPNPWKRSAGFIMSSYHCHISQGPWDPHISSKLSWNTHVDITAKKATQSLNFIRRNFSCCPARIHEQYYKTLVRPQLKYASSVWDNTIKCNTTKISCTDVQPVSQPCYRNCSGTLSSSM